jgi:diguanylate cyclase (GGDEF)-like protein/PAS domain S-box-containing protein
MMEQASQTTALQGQPSLPSAAPEDQSADGQADGQIDAAGEPLFDGLLEAAPDALVILDSAGRIVFANAQAELLFGYRRAQLLNRPVEMLFAPRFRSARAALLAEYSLACDAHPLSGGLDLCGQKQDGSEFPLGARFGHVTSGDHTFVMGIFHDITELKQHEEIIEEQSRQLREVNLQLEQLAMQDGLTGLKNHRAFREKLDEEFRRAVRYQTPLSVLMLDLDHFKDYNDRFGHAAGDAVLQTVARLFSEIARTTDFVARYGGEEFVILLPYTGRAGATVLADRFRSAIEKATWKERAVTISVGAATFEATGEAGDKTDIAEFLAAADQALYYSKNHGRNRVTHDAEINSQPEIDASHAEEFAAARPRGVRHYRANPLQYIRMWLSRAIREENIFLFLLGVRWLSLLSPALSLWLEPTPTKLAVFIIAVVITGVLSAFQTQFNRLVLQKPYLLLLDMVLSAIFIALTGGMDSPYGRYARLPIWAAAFFFQIRGGLIAVVAYIPFFLGALLYAHQHGSAPPELQSVFAEIVLLFMLALMFGYPSALLQRLRAATAHLHRAQREAARAETLAAMGKLAAHVSHEIRNPLSTIGGFARGILRRPDDEARVRKNAQIISDEVARLEQLLTDMLDMARPPELKLKQENLHEILDKAWLLSDSAAGEKTLIRVHKNYDPRLPPIEADASTLLRAFINVTRNAVQMMPQGGTVTITTRRLDDTVEVIISDTGPGIAAEVLPTIFTPFVSHRPNGTGLGLAATQKIIQQHGGRVEVQSDLGKGARFIFHLPLQVQPASASVPEAANTTTSS